jgi:hypothetical protein
VTEDAVSAQAYYFAAKQRIGLLGWSLVDIHCLFFASVYEKYALNPLQAWFYIQQASTRLQAHLKRQTKTSCSDDCTVRSDGLMQRVFWSVYKAEHELLPELPFRSSGIEVFTRTDSMFPSPPAFEEESNDASAFNEQDSSSKERSWAFYLAEISIRRTITDTIFTLYRRGERYWLNHVESLVRQCEDSEEQIQLWHSHLPLSVQFDPDGNPDNELAFFLKGRFSSWRSYILRPVLYYVLHRPSQQALSPQITICARGLVALCAESIIHYDQHHRHGGIWFVCRLSFTSALLLLSVVIKGDIDVLPPADWGSLVVMSISTQRKWEAQSADIRRLRMTLERLYTIVCHHTNTPTCQS